MKYAAAVLLLSGLLLSGCMLARKSAESRCANFFAVKDAHHAEYLEWKTLSEVLDQTGCGLGQVYVVDSYRLLFTLTRSDQSRFVEAESYVDFKTESQVKLTEDEIEAIVLHGVYVDRVEP
ncbi:MAG: hypothetical protein AAGG50_08880 [Bacteroidota bacterium]